MLTKDVSAEIQAVLATLSKEGKEPTVALVKGRLTTKVPMPALITVIKSWKSNQHVPKVEIAADADALTQHARIEALEAQVALLTTRLEKLENTHG
ncbi:hypothetical protein BCU70_13835 [Vibrio sp. 10N.286.49.C2]|uniref:hypothetical protein n=1 Tax=unclassified Vibrio TaxID=2614977 RepID=UPI000C8546CD|nr:MULTISPECIES: hypothetical protein [unclassified Vibrio]PMH38874.1 hypothetical protein BCU70_13835 [Vibrio sp. 10N.286.49.C2]PMH55349.1 hypothetical protein BCU66_09605 [Vibrio sp. 10N.286.49.B1]PMH78857.1 hypothetical protein BCU58_00615 [Vibrio sp. 10N.286.48.B7]